jgi:hypothetical protein
MKKNIRSLITLQYIGKQVGIVYVTFAPMWHLLSAYKGWGTAIKAGGSKIN